MAETIETFVARLQQEGVQAGQQAAEKLLDDARQQARQIVEQARTEAEQIIQQARKQADKDAARTRTELALASRDTLLRLRDALNRGLSAVLSRAAGQKLSDERFLGDLLKQVTMAYVQADIQGKKQIQVNLAPEMHKKLSDGAIQELAQAAQAGGTELDIRQTLSDAGFEYQVTGAKVEVTTASVAQSLRELIGPALRDLVDQAVAEQQAAGGQR